MARRIRSRTVLPPVGRMGLGGFAPQRRTESGWDGVLTISAPTAREGTALSFTVTADSTPSSNVTFVAETIAGGSAEAGVDYTPLTATAGTILANTRTATFTVTTAARADEQGSRTVVVRAREIAAGGVPTSQGSVTSTGTIVDATASPIEAGLHPRLGFTEVTLEDLRAKCAIPYAEGGCREMYQRFVRRWGDTWHESVPPSPTASWWYWVEGATIAALLQWIGRIDGIDYGHYHYVEVSTGKWAWVYQGFDLTPESGIYRDEAIRILTTWAAKTSGEEKAACAAVAYDWCYPWMTPAQRSAVLSAFWRISTIHLGSSAGYHYIWDKGWGDGTSANEGGFASLMWLACENDSPADCNGFDVPGLVARQKPWTSDLMRVRWWGQNTNYYTQTPGYDGTTDALRLQWHCVFDAYRTAHGLTWADLITGELFAGTFQFRDGSSNLITVTIPVTPDTQYYLNYYPDGFVDAHGTEFAGLYESAEPEGLVWTGTSEPRADLVGGKRLHANASWHLGSAAAVAVRRALGLTESAGRGLWWINKRFIRDGSVWAGDVLVSMAGWDESIGGRQVTYRSLILPDARGVTMVAPVDLPRSKRFCPGYRENIVWRSHPSGTERLTTGWTTTKTVPMPGGTSTPASTINWKANTDITTVRFQPSHWRFDSYGEGGWGGLGISRQGPLTTCSGDGGKNWASKQFNTSALLIPDVLRYPERTWVLGIPGASDVGNSQYVWGGVRNCPNGAVYDPTTLLPGRSMDMATVERYQDSNTVGHADLDYVRTNMTLAFPNVWQSASDYNSVTNTGTVNNELEKQRCRNWSRTVLYKVRPTDTGRDRVICIDRVSVVNGNQDPAYVGTSQYEPRILWQTHGWPLTISGTEGATIATKTATGDGNLGTTFYTNSGAYSWSTEMWKFYNGKIHVRTVSPVGPRVTRRGGSFANNYSWQDSYGGQLPISSRSSSMGDESIFRSWARIEVMSPTWVPHETFIHTLEVTHGGDVAAATEPVGLTATSQIKAFRWDGMLVVCMEAQTEDDQKRVPAADWTPAPAQAPLVPPGRSLPAGTHMVTLDGSGAGTYDLIWVDLVPSASYTLTVDGSPQGVTATAAGMVRTSVTVSNGSTISLS